LHKIKPYGKNTSFYTYYAGYVRRKFYSIAPYLGLVPKANTLGRKPGVSAIVNLVNEPWIEPSLLSIKDFADEIIVVDSSTDDTSEKVDKIKVQYGLNLKHIRKMCDVRVAWQTALKYSEYEWLLKWDGDFIAYTPQINRLKTYLTTLRKEKYYFIEFPHICLDVDLFRINKSNPYQIEGWLFKFSPPLFNLIERDPFPTFYEKKFLNTVYVMHLRSIKSPLRILERRYMGLWKLEENKAKYSDSFEEYVKVNVFKEFGVENLDKAAQIVYESLKEKVASYEKEIYGDYPKILKNYVKKEFNIRL
jgi:glycosyltransferase involved in cell wall biosynthesis